MSKLKVMTQGPSGQLVLRGGGDDSPLAKYLRSVGRYDCDKRVFHQASFGILDDCNLRRESTFVVMAQGGFRIRNNWAFKTVAAGKAMENITESLTATREELDESKRVLQNLANELNELADIIEPQLIRHIERLRTARMTAVNEVSQSLQALRDIRKFFLDKTYESEVERLREFMVLCRELQALKDSGVLDAVSDVILKLAVTK